MLKLHELSYWEKNIYFEGIDFLVIGAGIVGSSTALHLRKQYPDARILVVERGYLPAGASTKNAGFACFGSVTELSDDLEKMPEDQVWETVAARWEGLQKLREIIGDRHLDFQQNGSWDLIRRDEQATFLKGTEKLRYMNQKMFEITGHSSILSEDKNAARKFDFGSVETSFHNSLEGQIDTGKMMLRFHQLLADNNIRLLTGIEVLDIHPGEQEVDVSLSCGNIRAAYVAICVNGFAQKFLPEEDVRPARAQVIITKPIPNLKVQGTFHYQEGYYYFRNIHNRILFGGGRNLDFDGETTTELKNTDRITGQLEMLLQTLILPNTPFEVEHTWAGIMGMGSTKKPIVKKIHPRVATGVRLGGMGIAIGSLTGKKVAELLG